MLDIVPDRSIVLVDVCQEQCDTSTEPMDILTELIDIAIKLMDVSNYFFTDLSAFCSSFPGMTE